MESDAARELRQQKKASEAYLLYRVVPVALVLFWMLLYIINSKQVALIATIFFAVITAAGLITGASFWIKNRISKR
jgi:hypothetical protein